MTTPKSRKVPSTPIQKQDALVAGFNELNAALAAAGLLQHHAPTAVVSTPDATDDPTLVTLANALRAAYIAHIADTDAHVAADATNTVSAAVATTQAEARTLINELKIDLNAHILRAAAHRGVPPFDGRMDSVATADAADQTSSYVEADVDGIATLANSLKLVHNRGAAGKQVTLIDGSDDTTDYALANQIKAVLNRHLASGSSLLEIVAS